VTATTLLQRATDPRMLARLFGILEGVHMASLAVGSIVAPLLIALTGEQGAFLLAALAMLLAAASAWPTMRRLDDAAVARPREVALLRSIPMFAPLGVPAIERLATAMVPVHAHPGSEVVRQGEPGDHFFIITDGRVAISVDGERVREEGPGEAFGEIALLRNVPRTATVEALESTQLISLDRTTFLEAVTGQPASTAEAEATVARHLGAPGDTTAVEDSADARA
jgi:quercetin dioxygenase-like cupin family protein